jgi:hypothetical protein
MPKFIPETFMGNRKEPWLNSRPVLIAPGIMTESPIRLTVEDWEGFDLVLDIVAMPAQGLRTGRFACRNLTVKQRDGGPLVTTAAIRSVPVATLVRGTGARYLSIVDSVDGHSMSASDRKLDDVMVKQFHIDGPTDEVLGWVAHIYRMALVLGDPPTAAVENTLDLKRSTAGRWVSVAREKGFLSAAEGPGKAGG